MGNTNGTPTTGYQTLNAVDEYHRYRKWNIALAIIGAILLALVVAVLITYMALDASRRTRVVYTILGREVGNETSDLRLRGQLILDSSDKTIEWDLRYTNVDDVPLAVYINGPIPVGLDTGPLDIALCGSPSVVACDTTVPALLRGKIDIYNGNSLKTYISAIRALPAIYYITVHFGTSVVLRAELGMSAGN